jgi:hypothetical protein
MIETMAHLTHPHANSDESAVAHKRSASKSWLSMHPSPKVSGVPRLEADQYDSITGFGCPHEELELVKEIVQGPGVPVIIHPVPFTADGVVRSSYR